MKFLKKLYKRSILSPASLTITSILIAYVYMLMEWLFIVTKPNFSYSANWLDKTMILLNSGAILTILIMVCLIPLYIVEICKWSLKVKKIIEFVFAVFPAIVLTASVLLFIDNITYNLLKFGVVSTKGLIRGLYAVGFVLLIAIFYVVIIKIAVSIEKIQNKSNAKSKKRVILGLQILLVIFLVIPILLNLKNLINRKDLTENTQIKQKPNIILFTADGINATNLSVYGYSEPTTPFLEELAQESMVAENNFANAQGTIGSTTSILTGKYPAETRILTVEDKLQGNDSVEHLPAILKDYGYYTVQITYSYYADAYKVNIQDGFIESSGRKANVTKMDSALSSILPTDYWYFLETTTTRIIDRVAHIFFINDMTNVYLQVTQATEKFNDQQKLEYLLKIIDDSTNKPLFVHFHWMGTHGPKYYPQNQVYSAGKDPSTQEKYDNDFYLDTLVEFDNAVSKVYEKLEENEILDDTILLITSDHTQKWTNGRIPLIIRFPDKEYVWTISDNTQNLDIAPTLLDYLEIPIPSWMEGSSLLENPDKNRPIFIAEIPASMKDKITNKVVFPDFVAPFYQFGRMSVVVCDHWYQINTLTMIMTDGKVNGYVGSCDGSETTREEALKLIVDHMRANGFDVSTLKDFDINKKK